MDKETALKFIEAAKSLHCIDGEIEIDDVDDPLENISNTDIESVEKAGGTYVKAWVWVHIDEVE